MHPTKLYMRVNEHELKIELTISYRMISLIQLLTFLHFYNLLLAYENQFAI